MKRNVLTSFAVLCMLSTVFLMGLSFTIKPVKASGTIYIRADGSIEGTDRILRDGNIYIFIGNISVYEGGIVVQRNNTIVDGDGYTLVGTGGFFLSKISNVTIRNTNIKSMYGGGTGIELGGSNNTICGNNISNFQYGIKLENYERVSVPYGYEYVVVCHNNSITGNNITNNSWGITGGDGMGVYSYNNTFSRNNIINNNRGIVLYHSENSILWGNTIANNGVAGVSLYMGKRASNNVFYHNNFVNNTLQVELEGDVNIWDNGYPSGGNYWSNYTGVDLDFDGIGDSAHVIGEDNTDNYPLMGMFSDFNATSEHHVQTICNSTISDLKFNGTAISFNVTGETDTTGLCRICIPRALMNETYHVFVNSTEVQCNLLPCSNTTHSYLYFTYNLSTQEVIIIPEFPSFLILPLFMIATLLVVILYRRKHSM